MARPRARDLGIRLGTGTPGPLDAITDVAGVRVGHRTVRRGPDGAPDAARTGVTAIFPHEGRTWDAPVYAATHILNGYGELIGINSIREWGILESPVVLTSSILIGKVYDATVGWIARQDPKAGEAVMPCVTECDDSGLNAVLAAPIEDGDVWAALDGGETGEVEEGSVGAGTGMQCFDFKGGIGTASRVLPDDQGGFVVGALVLTNHGDRNNLLIDGVRVGEAFANELLPVAHREGSCVVVLATDAPLLPHQLRRVAERAGMGLARGGSHASNGSGEQFLAFSTANRIGRGATESVETVVDGRGGSGILSALFRAAVESTEEAVVNALVAAETVVGRDGNTLHAIDHERLIATMRSAGRLA